VSDEVAPDYNSVAGQSLHRLSALSDGVFAVAMTLLVLDLKVPTVAAHGAEHPLWTNGSLHDERVFWHALSHVGPQFLTYLMSFLTLGIFWIAQQAQLNNFERGNRRLSWTHISFLAAVALMPFSTSVLADYGTYRLAVVVYWLNLLLLGVLLYTSIAVADRAGLVKEEMTGSIQSMHKNRIVAYQAGYAACAAFCVISTYLSIGLLFLMQLYSVLSSGRPPLPGDLERRWANRGATRGGSGDHGIETPSNTTGPSV
jgi:uncharacterized membrane protein